MLLRQYPIQQTDENVFSGGNMIGFRQREDDI
jgi:hypothetical protein